MVNLYDKLTSEKGKKIALNVRKAAGISKLKFLEPFNEIDPPGGDSVSFEDIFSSP